MPTVPWLCTEPHVSFHCRLGWVWRPLREVVNPSEILVQVWRPSGLKGGEEMDQGKPGEGLPCLGRWLVLAHRSAPALTEGPRSPSQPSCASATTTTTTAGAAGVAGSCSLPAFVDTRSLLLTETHSAPLFPSANACDQHFAPLHLLGDAENT